MIYEKVKEIFMVTKERELHGEFQVDDESFIRYITANLVIQKLRYGIRFNPTSVEDIKRYWEPISMREFTKQQIKGLDLVDESQFAAIERQNARTYNDLNPRTRREFEERNATNKKGAKLNTPIEIFNYQKEAHQLLSPSGHDETEEEKKAKTTLGQFKRHNYKKIRLPHFENLHSHYQNQMMQADYTEDEQIIHTYLIEKGIGYHYTRAFCRLLTKYDCTISEKDLYVYLKISEIPSFPICMFYLKFYFNTEGLQYDDNFSTLLIELESVNNLIKFVLLDYEKAGYYSTMYDNEDYTIFAEEMSPTHFQEVAVDYKSKEAQQFNALMKILQLTVTK